MKPVATSLVSCSRAEVVECPGRNPCSKAGSRCVDSGKYEHLHNSLPGRVARLDDMKFLEKSPYRILGYG